MMLHKLLVVLIAFNLQSIKAVSQQLAGSNISESLGVKADVILVSSDPVTINHTTGVIGLTEGSIGGKFVAVALIEREALWGFASEDEGEYEDEEDFFDDAFLANPLETDTDIDEY